jgi:CMP-N-acetylneuraminic acid synthetase
MLAGKPLLAYTAETALAASRLAGVILSTDDQDVAEVGRRCGLEPFLRPAGAPADNQAMAQDAVKQFEASGETCDAVCILDPATPFRRPEDIDRCIALLEKSGADAVVSVVPVPQEYHPRQVYLQAADGSLAPVSSSADLPPAFHHDGSVCVIRRDALMNGQGLLAGRTLGYVVDPVRFVKLERPEDWGRAERIARLGSHKATAGRIAPLAGPRLTLPAGWMPTPIADALVSAGVGLLREGLLGSSPVAQGKYLEPVWKAANPRWREVETPFLVREGLLPPEREIVAHEFLDFTLPALLVPRSRTGAAPSVQRIEDPFRPHAELPPDIRTAETPLVAALAARRLEGASLEHAREPNRREIAGGSRAFPQAVPIEFSGLVGKAAGSVRPVQPFKLGGAELGPARKSRPFVRPWPPAVLVGAFFSDPQPLDPASGDLAARERLVHAIAFRRDGRLLPLAASARIALVEVIDTHAAELPTARPLVFGHPLAGAHPSVVGNRARVQASTWLAENWERFARESVVVVFGSVASRAHGVQWPAAGASVFAHQPERPAKAGSRTKTDPYGLYAFPLPGAGVPRSTDLRTLLRGAAVRKIAAPAIRPDTKTVVGATPLGAEFHGSGEPRHSPLFLGVLRVAMMPGGVFHYVEIEDHEDYGTWSRAQHYPAKLAIPASGCGLPAPAWLAANGYLGVFAGPYAGRGAHSRVYGEFPPAPQVVLAHGMVELIAMDFAAIAESGSSRWRLPFKKTAMFT